ncbi:MAG: tetratricopeptide repeat protein, partial [Acidobacteriota bacterium]|nr:tetratricopeptide repeat protein [Acidobacteriota bacterium]
MSDLFDRHMILKFRFFLRVLSLSGLILLGTFPSPAQRRAGGGSADEHDKLGLEFLKKGQVAEAIETFRRAIKLKPDLASAHRH